LGKLFANGESGYFSTIGTYGLGAKLTNALSDDFIAKVKRNGRIYRQTFKKGRPTSDVEIIGTVDLNDTGTKITFHPDSTIFKTTIQPNDKKLQNRLDEITSLNTNLKVNYKNELANVDTTFYYPNGIADYINKKLLKDKKLLFEEPIYYSSEYVDNDETIKVEFSLMYVDDVESNEIIKTFANNVSTKEHGTHLVGFKEGYKEAINQYSISKKWITEPIEIKYLMDNICLIVSVKLRECELDGQTKNKLGNLIAKDGVANVVKEYFNKLSKEQQVVIQTIVERANKVKEAEEAARRARINTRTANKIKKIALPGKLADCSSNKGYSELFLVEGVA
jgi:DNA gyrase subunit B